MWHPEGHTHVHAQGHEQHHSKVGSGPSVAMPRAIGSVADEEELVGGGCKPVVMSVCGLGVCVGMGGAQAVVRNPPGRLDIPV